MATAPTEPGSALVPAPRAPEVTPPQRGAAPVGTLLEKIRRRLGYSIDTVCTALHLTERELNQYESGLREPPVSDLERLAEFYGVDASRLRPGAGTTIEHSDRDVLWLGWAPVELDRSGIRDNRTIVPRIALTLRTMRLLSETEPITIRDRELKEIGSALDLADANLPALLIEWLGVEATRAFELIARMRHATASTKELPEAGNVDVGAREGHADA